MDWWCSWWSFLFSLLSLLHYDGQDYVRVIWLLKFFNIEFREQTTPLYAYSIPFEVDSPVSFRVSDSSLKSSLFEFSIIIGESTSRVIYEECDQFSIGEPDGICFGTTENYLCSGEKGDDEPLLPFLTWSDHPYSVSLNYLLQQSNWWTSSVSNTQFKSRSFWDWMHCRTDLRAFFIYQDGQKLFTWDVMMAKDNETVSPNHFQSFIYRDWRMDGSWRQQKQEVLKCKDLLSEGIVLR